MGVSVLAQVPAVRNFTAPDDAARAKLPWYAQWSFFAPALLLVAGVAIRFSASHAADETPGASLSVVLDVSDESNLGDEMNHLRTLHGARYADLDDEMNQLLADGRVVR